MKISIHRALSELKLIEKKLIKNITEFLPVGLSDSTDKVNGHYLSEDFKTGVTANYQSITDLIERKVLIKSAINLANGITKVLVSGKEISITEAINMKTIIDIKKTLLQKMNSSLKTTESKLTRHNEGVEKDATESIAHLLGSEKKTDAKQVEELLNTYRKNRIVTLADPIKCEVECKKLYDEIVDFEAEIDTILSEANATTFIEV